MSLLTLLCLAGLALAQAQPVPNVRNLRARLQPDLDAIFVEWQFSQPTNNIMFTLRYRTGNVPGPWKYIRTKDSQVKLPLSEYKNGDQVHVQIQAERGGQVIEDWSQELVITVNKKVSVGGIIVDEGALLPPLDFTARVMSPSSVHLEWTPAATNKPDIFYLVHVKQLTSESGTTLHNQQIKTSANSFTLGKLIPGEKYEMTIRSATPKQKISSTAAIVEITMPKENDYFEIGNLIISSLFKSSTHGAVNLTWEVPPQLQHKILAYDVEFAEMGSSDWQRIQFHGSNPSATLYNLKSDTEYQLRIKTTMTNKIVMESAQFKYKTPRVETNPIQKVDVIYSHDVNSVKLQWILEPHVQVDRVAGYDVYLSEDKDKPDSQWRLVRLDNKDSSLSLHDLKGATVYFVRVNVRNTDGSIIRAPTVYRFKTIEEQKEQDEKVESNSLSYRNVNPGQVEISWTFPTHILDSVVGATILYTDRKDIAPEQWERVVIDDSKNTTITLRNLREGTRYSVQIIPTLYTGEFDYESRELFELKTDTRPRAVPSPQASANPLVKVLPPFSHPVGPQPKFEQMLKTESEYMRIISCNPDAITTGCAWDEMCITRVEDSTRGWCISNTLRDSILNS
ncbi:unnamed protein product [Caenorhabditis auriculariae]|uniref:Fibronectin type-III domain-containing protein n=1 Tax=Caenorhabditis auriculariae TaxID=2777116 RepID=A0A8S1GZE5_9PELO|nr:unnamed protein product [Caenorhabditis auriculariae]